MGEKKEACGFSVNGFVELKLVDKETGEIKQHLKEHNMVTPAGRQLILDKAISTILQTASDMYGATYSADMLNQDVLISSGKPTKPCNVIHLNTCLTNTLLNVEESDLAALNENSSFVQTFINDFGKNERVIGHASNSDTSSTSEYIANKEGIYDFAEPDYVKSPFINAKSWKYDSNVANGTFNAIAMMPATCVKQNDGPGLRFSKLIDRVKFQHNDFGAYSTMYCPPGIPGVTANDEILLNFTYAGNSKWRYNITTGETKSVTETEVFWTPISYAIQKETGIPSVQDNTPIMDYYVEGEYLYIVTRDFFSPYLAEDTGSLYTVLYINVYNIATQSFVTYFTTPKAFYYSITNAKFFKIPGDTNLYIKVISPTGGYSDSPKMFALSKTGPYYDVASLVLVGGVLAGLVATMPSNQSLLSCLLTNYGSNYVLYVRQHVNSYDDKTITVTSDTLNRYNGYVFTNLEDFKGSIIDCIYNIEPTSLLFSNAAFSGFINIGRYFSDSKFSGTSVPGYNKKSGMVYVSNRTGAKHSDGADSHHKGIYLTLDKWWGNMVSYKKLATPITKTESDILWVTYGYEIGVVQ